MFIWFLTQESPTVKHPFTKKSYLPLQSSCLLTEKFCWKSLGQTLNTTEEDKHGEIERKTFREFKTELSFLKQVSNKAQEKSVCWTTCVFFLFFFFLHIYISPRKLLENLSHTFKKFHNKQNIYFFSQKQTNQYNIILKNILDNPLLSTRGSTLKSTGNFSSRYLAHSATFYTFRWPTFYFPSFHFSF